MKCSLVTKTTTTVVQEYPRSSPIPAMNNPRPTLAGGVWPEDRAVEAKEDMEDGGNDASLRFNQVKEIAHFLHNSNREIRDTLAIT